MDKDLEVDFLTALNTGIIHVACVQLDTYLNAAMLFLLLLFMYFLKKFLRENINVARL